MNVIQSMPSWAQKAAGALQNTGSIPGTQRQKASSEDAEGAIVGAGMLGYMTAADEQPGDQAMGEPGRVVTDGLEVNFGGSEGDLRLAVTAQDHPEHVTYARLRGDEQSPEGKVDLVNLTRTESGIQVEGLSVDMNGDELDGWKFEGLIAG